MARTLLPPRWAFAPLLLASPLVGCTVTTGTATPGGGADPNGAGKPIPSDQGAEGAADPDPSDPSEPEAEGTGDAGAGDGNNGSTAHGPGGMAAPTGQPGGGPACAPDKACPEGMGCDGLFHDKRGQCIPEDQAKAQCESKGGEWGEWGMRASRFCNPVHPDAGKACKDGKDCAAGVCIADDKKSGQGQCQKYGIHFGCYARMENGKAGQKLCVD